MHPFFFPPTAYVGAAACQHRRCKGLLRLATRTADKNGRLSRHDAVQILRPMTTPTPTSRAARKGYGVAPEPNALSVVVSRESRDYGR
jgi:hypothetical protein